MGVISQAAGSAYAECGGTKLMVGVYGPRQAERRATFSDNGRVECELRLAGAAADPAAAFAQGQVERDLAATVQTALEAVVDVSSFPKLVLHVYCTVLEGDGAEVAVAITAAALAVAEAGVAMRDLVSACSVARVRGQLLLDPTAQETAREDGGVTLAATGTGGEVAQLVTRGRWSDGELKEALELALGGCAQLDAAGRAALREAEAARMEEVAAEAAAQGQQQGAGS